MDHKTQNKLIKYTVKQLDNPLHLFKHRQPITTLKFKPQRIDCITKPNNTDFSLLKERQMNYTSKMRAHATKIDETKVCYIDHFKKTIYMWNVDSLYRFESFTERKNVSSSVKSFSRDEIKYRKKNVNYLLKKIDFEEGRDMKIEQEDIVQFIDDKSCKDTIEQTKNVLNSALNNINTRNRIFNTIYRARIVNFFVLNDIYKDEDEIMNCLTDMCTKVNGRFILKNIFYDSEVRKKREKIINRLRKSEELFIEKDDDIFLITELCDKKDKNYFMKGVYEDIDFKETKIDFSEIIREFGVINFNKLSRETELNDDALYEFINNNQNVVKLNNGTFTLFHGEHQEIRSVVIEMFKQKNLLKKSDILNEIKNKTGKDINVFLFGKILKEFCILKGGNYILKDGSSKK
ncbi:hypothetical protein COBT_000211 [Conglomerata obtusa]